MIKNNTSVPALLIILLSSFSIYATQLVISHVQQATSFTCWAACCEMILKAYGNIDIRQQAIASAYGKDADKWNTLDGTVKALAGYTPKINAIMYDSYASMSQIQNEIEGKSTQGRVPMIAVWQMYGADEHMLLIIGCGNIGKSDEYIIVDDPEEDDGPILFSHADFKSQRMHHDWTMHAKLDTRPPTPIPVGTGEGEYIYISSGTSSITQTPQSVNFTAQKSGSHSPISWVWNLIFPHATGDCIVASWSVNSSSRTSTWSIPNFTMPAGYRWKFNYEGKIPGRVEVTLNDNYSPPSHIASKDVMFIPSTPYAGTIEYYGRTISTTQPEVKAHEYIALWSDLFNSGTNIDIRSGNTIIIKDGITINNGSSVDFIVDPAVW